MVELPPIVIGIAGIAVILAIVFGSWVFAERDTQFLVTTSNATNSIITPCSYQISLSGSTVNAENCITNHIDFSGTNTSQIINQAINSTQSSQLIFVHRGLYKLTSPIELQHGLTLVGESAGQNVTNGRQGTHFWVASGRNINALEYTKNYLGYFITLRDLFVDGNYQNNLVAGNGIYLNVNASDFEADNIYIDGFRQNCFLSDSTFNDRIIGDTFEHCQKDGFYMKGGTDAYISGSKALTNSQYGFEFGTTNGGVTALMFSGNYIAGNTNENVITFNVHSAVITSNQFQEVSNIPPFHLVMENACSNSLVDSNSFVQAGTTMTSAVDITHASCVSAKITNNQISGTYTTPVLDSGTTTMIRNNVGFKTENSGTATITSVNTNVNVTHGLSYTPSINDISITPQGAEGSCSSWFVANPTSTTFQIKCNVAPTASSLSFSWQIRRT